MLKQKLQYFGHLMQRTDSLEKILMPRKIKGRSRREQKRMRWLDGITDLMDMSFFFVCFNGTQLLYNIMVVFATHKSAMGVHMFHILNSPPTPLLIPSLRVISVHQPWAPCLMYQTWTGDLFPIHVSILSNHPTLAFSHRVRKSGLYICVSYAVAHIGSSLPSF